MMIFKNTSKKNARFCARTSLLLLLP